MQRKATSKRLRFEVFKRDYFTCQYCGAQPPSVVLVCDHVIPVAKGGLTKAENLVTACEACNAGKSDKLLGDAIVRPDADLMYLNIQQEIAELERYEQEKERYSLALEKAANRIITESWARTFDGDWCPSIRFVSQVIEKYDVLVAEKAIEATAIAFNQGKLKKHQKWFAYTWAVARNTNEQMHEISDEELDLETSYDRVAEQLGNSYLEINSLKAKINKCSKWCDEEAESSFCYSQWARFYEQTLEELGVDVEALNKSFKPASLKQLEETHLPEEAKIQRFEQI